jgi:hypothetical protein
LLQRKKRWAARCCFCWVTSPPWSLGPRCSSTEDSLAIENKNNNNQQTKQITNYALWNCTKLIMIWLLQFRYVSVIQIKVEHTQLIHFRHWVWLQFSSALWTRMHVSYACIQHTKVSALIWAKYDSVTSFLTREHIWNKDQFKLDLPLRVEGNEVVKPQLSVSMSCQWVLHVSDGRGVFPKKQVSLSSINNDWTVLFIWFDFTFCN